MTNPPIPSGPTPPVRVRFTCRSWDGEVSEPFDLTISPGFGEEAAKWTHLAAIRARWRESAADILAVNREAVSLLAFIGLGDAELRRLARAQIIEIGLPWTEVEKKAMENCQADEDAGCFGLPWEFIIVHALSKFTTGPKTPLIVRHLETGRPSPPPRPVSWVLGAYSCPPELDDATSSYERELRLVSHCLAGQGKQGPEFISLPEVAGQRLTAKQLKEKMAIPPAGFDAVHFLSLETVRAKGESAQVWLPDFQPGENGCAFNDLAKLLTSGRNPPQLVTYSFCSTGPRLAALTVSAGAQASIGFQDLVTDAQCENFFARFYSRWRECGWQLLPAFEDALRHTASTLRGAGIILWTGHSLLGDGTKPAEVGEATEPAIADVRALTRSGGSVSVSSKGPTRRIDSTRGNPAAREASPPRPPSPEIEVTIKPYPRINYAVLHNQQVDGPGAARRSIFESFKLHRLRPDGDLPVVDIEVSLYAGDHVGVWRQRRPLQEVTTDLAAEIHVPLTSVLARSLRESLCTSIETLVRIDRATIDHRMHPVSLLAVEEWLDDGICHVWLPSFVLPRDPAVADIVQRSRRTLCALTDDFAAGFDGYRTGLSRRVDEQVQALWATLAIDWQLSYVVPPPAFSAASQRVRRPTEVIDQGSGTCLDLALMLAACMEFIGLRPVLILSPGHAYTGWWRDEGAVVEDVTQRPPPTLTERSASFGVPHLDQQGRLHSRRYEGAAWTMGKERHAAIVRAVEQGDLAALETTGLTECMSFAKARWEGAQRLRRRLEFEHLIDIKCARNKNVTPLPICL